MFQEKFGKYKYISFDIFDTLIKRNVSKPSDIFIIVENKYNLCNKEKITDFKLHRIKSEKKVRLDYDKKEITLDLIYREIEKQYGHEISNKLKHIEEETEINFTQKTTNKDVLDIYEYAKQNDKVILTSDMYLPKKTIEKILSKSGIKYKYLFLSSDIMKKKSTSEIFRHILHSLNISPSELIHIGDNKNSDSIIPNSLGIDTVLIPRKINNINLMNKAIQTDLDRNIDYNILYNFINNNLVSDEYFYRFGYMCFGPLLLGFTEWLKARLLDEKIENVFFLARDGKIMKEVFDIMNNNEMIKSYYFMASRRSIIVPSFYKKKSISEILDMIKFPKKISIKYLQKRLGIDEINIDNILKKYNLEMNQKYELFYLKNNKQDFLEELYPFIIENSKNEYDSFMKYKDKMHFDGKVAIVDIGWYGNMQSALTKICDNEIHGYYLGLRQNKKEDIISEGYLFDKGKNKNLDDDEFPLNSIFEFIFSAEHGSVRRFIVDKPFYELYESENIDEYENNALTKIQSGAKEFIKDYVNSSICDDVFLDVDICSKNVFSVLHYPDCIDAEMIGNIRFKDDEIKYIAKNNNLKKYLFNPKSFFKDLKCSLWKIGFLKRTFKINLPYKKIYTMIKNK